MNKIKPSHKTTAQLLALAERDTDAVSVFEDGINIVDSDCAIFVVKGRAHIDYLKAICERQGLLTDKPVIGPACNVRRPWEVPQ